MSSSLDTPPKTGISTIWIAAGVVGLLLVVGLVWYFSKSKSTPTKSKASSTTATTPPSSPSTTVPASVLARYVSLKRVTDNIDTDAQGKRTINLATFSVWVDVDGSLVRIPPVSVTASPRHMDSATWDKSNVLDDNPDTIYHAPLASVTTQPFITLDLGVPRKVARVLLIPRPGYGNRMVGLQLQLADGSGTIVYARNVTAAQDLYEYTVADAADPADTPLLK
jgi:LPXTG-motif cell wall-anchored protein